MASARRAVQLAVLLGVAADAVPSSRGVLLLPRGGQGTRVDDALLARASRAVRGADLLVLELADGRVGVQRWRAGRLVDRPHYGLVAGVDGDAERVLLGHLAPGQAAGATSTDEVDRRDAAAALLGPVRPWQLVVGAVLLLAAGALAASAALDLAAGRGDGGWDVVRVVLWTAVTAYSARQLAQLLGRRRREREGAPGQS